MQDSTRNQDPDDLPIAAEIDRISDAFEEALKAGETPAVHDYLLRLDAAIEYRERLAVELILLDLEYRSAQGQSPSPEDYQLPTELLGAVPKAFAGRSSLEKETLGPNGAKGTKEMETIAPGGESANEPALGDRIQYFGDYELIEEVARGGMGVVYKAKQISLGRTIALKMILSGQIAGEEEVRRFRLEAEAAANLDHPGIVPIYDIGEHSGQHYFTMKLIDGKTLTDLSPQLRGDRDRIVRLVAKIADAVHHAHQRGILHRDLKPGNVLVDSCGHPLVTDFGLARKLESDQALTQTGAVVGTPGFMSPEQASGKAVTTAADIYSLGAILYELLCGFPPHAKESVLDTLMSVINDPPTPPREHDPEIPADLELIALKCLEKDPDKRYSSAAELAKDLHAFAAGEPVSVRAPSPVEIMRAWVHKNYGSVVWVPIIAVVVGCITGFSIWVATLGGDQGMRLETLKRFSGVAKAQLIDWRNWFWPAIASFVILMSTIGYATARLVRTQNRAADIGAGLSVGLLTGLIAFVAGFGALFIEFMTAQGHDDQIVLQAALGNHDYARELVRLTYPDLGAGSDQQRIRMVTDKIENDENASTLIGMWVGTPICLGLFGLVGLLQTYVAGPIVRSRSDLAGLVSYLCFGIAIVGASYIVGGNLTMYLMHGAGFIMHPLLPGACLLIIALGIISVIRRWALPLQLFITVVWLSLFAPFVWQSIQEAPAPQIAQRRAQVKKLESWYQAEPQNPDRALKLAASINQFGAYLTHVGWHADALDQYLRAAETLENDPLSEHWNASERQIHANALYGAASAALKDGQAETSAELFARHAEKHDPSNRASKQFATAIWQSGGRPSQLISVGAATEPSGWFKTARQLRHVMQYREDTKDLDHPVSDLSDDEMIDRVLQQVSKPDDDESWMIRKTELARWLGSRQQWKLYGPHEIREGDNETVALDQPYGPEEDLLSGQPIPADKTVVQYTGLPVELSEHLGDKQGVVGYAVTEITVDAPQIITLRVGSNDGVKIWIGGKQVHRNRVFRDHVEASDLVPVKLEQGTHTLVMKISQGTATWGCILDASDSEGWPIALWGGK